LVASLSRISCLAPGWLTSLIIEAECELVNYTLSPRAAVISKEFNYLVGCRVIDRDHPTRGFRRIKYDTRRISVESSYCSVRARWLQIESLTLEAHIAPGGIELAEIDAVYRRLMRRQIEFGMKHARAELRSAVYTPCARGASHE